MIFSWERRIKAFEELIEEYPNIKVIEEKADCVRLEGFVLINRKSNDFRLCKEYEIRLIVYKDENKLPEAYDISNQVDSSYSHRYSNGGLCLDTDTAIRLRFEEGIDLCLWMKEFVEIYYFSYEYYKRNAEFPFGERSHGSVGTIEMYGELFHMAEKKTIVNCMGYLAKRGYFGHDECPCGSKKYIRKCHKKVLLPFFNNKKRLQIVKNDYQILMKERFMEKYEGRHY